MRLYLMLFILLALPCTAYGQADSLRVVPLPAQPPGLPPHVLPQPGTQPTGVWQMTTPRNAPAPAPEQGKAKHKHRLSVPAPEVPPCRGDDAYIPYDSNWWPIVRLRLALHVMAKADGSGNFRDNEQDRQWILKLFSQGGAFYGHPGPVMAGDTVTVPLPLSDTRIRLHIDTVIFHYDDEDWNFKKHTGYWDQNKEDTLYSTSKGYRQAEHYHKKYIEPLPPRLSDSTLNIFLVEFERQGGRGMAQALSSKRWAYIVGMYNSYVNGDEHGHWIDVKLIAHEIGHSLGLEHPYGSHYCKDLPSTKKGITNNIMDSWPGGGWGFTPCQVNTILGAMHNVRGDIGHAAIPDWQAKKPGKVYRVRAGDTVTLEGHRRLDGDIVVERGATLIVKCTLHLPQGATINLEKKARLIVDGGTVTNLCGGSWGGVLVKGKKRKRLPKAVGLLNGGKVEKVE